MQPVPSYLIKPDGRLVLNDFNCSQTQATTSVWSPVHANAYTSWYWITCSCWFHNNTTQRCRPRRDGSNTGISVDCQDGRSHWLSWWLPVDAVGLIPTYGDQHNTFSIFGRKPHTRNRASVARGCWMQITGTRSIWYIWCSPQATYCVLQVRPCL